MTCSLSWNPKDVDLVLTLPHLKIQSLALKIFSDWWWPMSGHWTNDKTKFPNPYLKTVISNVLRLLNIFILSSTYKLIFHSQDFSYLFVPSISLSLIRLSICEKLWSYLVHFSISIIYWNTTETYHNIFTTN